MPATGNGMRVAPGVYARRFDEELIVLDVNGGTYFGLDEVGAEIWARLGRGEGLAEIATGLVSLYDVDVDRARRDVEALVEKLVEAGLLVREGTGEP